MTERFAGPVGLQRLFAQCIGRGMWVELRVGKTGRLRVVTRDGRLVGEMPVRGLEVDEPARLLLRTVVAWR